MKKYIPYLIIIIALGGAAAWYMLRQSPDAIKKREGDFAVKNEKEITRIVIDDSEKKKHFELSKGTGVWLANNKYAAREDLVKQLLEAVSRVQSLTPVPRAAHDNVLREMMSRGLHVKVYTTDANKPEKSYWVGGATVDGQGTYMLLELGDKNASRPHITYVPGARSYLTPRFETDEEVWRTRVVFNYERDEIKSLKVEYLQDEKNSFVINQVAKDSFALDALDPKFRINDIYKQKYLKQYLGFYSAITIEAFDNSNEQKDSIEKTQPYCIITVTENDTTVNQVKLFYLPLNKRSKSRYDIYGRELTHDLERYYATIHNGSDFTIVQFYVFGNLLRNYKDFFFKPSAGK